MPALLTSRPMLGWRARIAAAVRSTSLRSDTSHSSYSPPSSAASASRRSRLRATSTQCQPSRASSLAVAAPMPLDAPVTTATLTSLLADAYDALCFGLAALGVGDDRPQRVLALRRAAAPPDGREETAAAAPVRGEQLAAVEEPDGADRGSRGREDGERRPSRRALVRLGRDPGD